MPSSTEPQRRAPLVYSGSLDAYESFDVTSQIGREFPKLQLSQILSDDAQIRDLAILASQRGAIFFRNQDIDVAGLKTLGNKLGELAGRPKSSLLHRHPLSSKDNVKNHDENGDADEEVFFVSSEREKENHRSRYQATIPKLASYLWHSDITFEHVPSDYAILKMAEMPNDVGGDTLFASGYELYDRMSPHWQKLCEGLTATHYQPVFSRVLQQSQDPLITENRGNPENSGLDFKATHPVIRTNPVTGWKHLFAAGQQIYDGKINGVTDREDEILKQYFLQLITENHDLQCRFKWNLGDVVVWDNRSTFHTATADYTGKRTLIRITSIGEKPYFDPNSISRRQALSADLEDEDEAEVADVETRGKKRPRVD